ncbi:MAG: hypothetical protein Kow00105_04400 [Phycisphaeraceae bacterium]
MKINAKVMTEQWKIDLAGVVGCIVITIACYGFLVRPVLEERREYAELQPLVMEKSAAVKQAQAEVNTLKRELRDIESQLAGLPLHMEPASKINSRLAVITELAERVGIEVHSLLPEPVRPGGRYDVVNINLAGEGDYISVTRFMALLHDQFADLSVSEFSLKAAGSDGDRASYDIGLAWYTLPSFGLAEEKK